MIFVNQIGEIVHGCVDDFHGAPNKNMGETFLLIWRLSGVSPGCQMKLADMAMMAFVRIIAEVNKSPVLAQYRHHPGMLQRVPGYRVQLGFGLHGGWAIEGAIGSDIKIDASYLSPNVNVASRLEQATKQFGVWILMSHFLVEMLSPGLGKHTRIIDHVTLKGSRVPVRLYTLDLDVTRLSVEGRCLANPVKNRFKMRQIREARKKEKWSDRYDLGRVFVEDLDVFDMRGPYSMEFFRRFFTGFRNYEAGEWMVARDLLYTCHYTTKSVSTPVKLTEEDWPQDGPTVALLRFMRQTDYVAPEDWPGHRVLNSKTSWRLFV